MAFSTGILLAFVTLIVWSIGDIISKVLLNKKTSIWFILVIAELSGAIILFLITLSLNQLESFLSAYSFLIVGLAVINFASMALFYKSLELNQLSIASPIIYSSVLVTVLLGVIFLKESLNMIQIVSVLLVMTGIVILTYKPKAKIRIDFSVIIPVLAMILFGVYYFLVKITTQYFRPINVTWSINLLTGLMCIPLAIKHYKDKPSFRTLNLIVLLGMLNIFGFLAFNIAITLAPLSVVTLIKSSTPAVTIFFAFSLLKEKISPFEILGAISAIIGVFLLSVA